MSGMMGDGVLRLAVPADLTVAAAEDCRQALLAALTADPGPAVIEFTGGVRVGAVALQLGLAAAAALRDGGWTVGLGPTARAALSAQGLEAGA